MATSNTRTYLVLGLILLLAASLRLANLSTLPTGLHIDEAFNGLDALKIIAGDRPVFLPDNNGREPLGGYLIALSITVLGRTPAAIRLPMLLASTLTVLGVYLLAARLTNRRIGLLAALICTFTVWPILLGRLGTRPVLLPLCLAFGLWLVIRGWQTGRQRDWLLAGVAFGLAFYTYTPIRIVILVLPLWALILTARGQGQRLWPGAALFAGAMLLTAAPILLYMLDNWALITQRSADVFIISPNYSRRDNIINVLRQTYIVPQMFIMPERGDPNWRQNIANRAVFDPLIAIPFVISLGLTVFRRQWRGRLWLCGLWVGAGLLPTILSREIPNFLRASAILPVLFIWPALGTDWLYQQLKQRIHTSLALTIVGALLLGSMAITVHDYWLDRYLAHPEVSAWFESPETDLALEVNRFLGIGWQSDSLTAMAGEPIANRQVWIDARIGLGHPTQQFLIPLLPDTTPALQTYHPDAPFPTGELAAEVLFIVTPEGAEQLAAQLPPTYTVTIEDGPWTPDSTLRESYLPYRRVIAALTPP